MIKPPSCFTGITAKTIIATAFLVLAVGYLDYLAWDEAAFSFFYLLPVLFVTWRLGLRCGIFVSVLCAVVWFLNDSVFTKHSYVNPVALYWNILIAFSFFVTFAFLLDRRKKAEKAREEVQEKLLQAQKMESVGRLAGGVAHDFNNLLTAIIAYSGFVLAGLAADDPKREDVKEILNAADRAAMLTKQLLAFSRKQILDPKVADLSVAVADLVKMLRRIIGENVQIETKFAERACLVMVDIGQIGQVLVNLAVNARDAMPDGGTLSLETGFVIREKEADIGKVPKPPHRLMVCLTVRDTGGGMTVAVKEHIFEPFFTTKEAGKGTGLGLSTVFGIVKQSGGEIEVESAPGKGTTFRLYFPHTEALPVQDKVQADSKLQKGGESILLVEDDESLRRLGERILRNSGYTVITAANGEEGLAAAGHYGKPLDLLLTDVVMPGMSGRELGRELARRKQVRRILYMSGYTDDEIAKHNVLEAGIAFIYKPFTAEALTLKLREVLDGPAAEAEA